MTDTAPRAPGGAPTLPVPPCGHCHSFLPGHGTHWMMAKRLLDAPRRAARVVDITADAVSVEFDGEVHVWHHHEPDRLRAATVMPNGAVWVIEGRAVILVGHSYGVMWFYCSREPLTPCSLDTP